MCKLVSELAESEFTLLSINKFKMAIFKCGDGELGNLGTGESGHRAIGDHRNRGPLESRN